VVACKDSDARQTTASIEIADVENATYTYLHILWILFELMDECKMRDVRLTCPFFIRRRFFFSFVKKNMFRFEIRLWSSHSYGAWAWHPGSFTHTWAQIESTVNGMLPKRAVTHYEYTRTIPEIYQNDTGRGRSRMYATWEVRGEGLYWLRELRERHAATMAISLNHT